MYEAAFIIHGYYRYILFPLSNIHIYTGSIREIWNKGNFLADFDDFKRPMIIYFWNMKKYVWSGVNVRFPTTRNH